MVDAKGLLFWREAIIARLVKSEVLYAPRVEVADSDLLSHDQRARIQDRLNQFITDHVMEVLQPLMLLAKPESLLNPEEKPEEKPDQKLDQKPENTNEASKNEVGTDETSE